MKRPIFTQPSEPIELTPRSTEAYKASLAKLAEEEQQAQASLREVLGEIDTKKATKSQLETNILQLQDKERKALERAGDAKESCDRQETIKQGLQDEVAKLREEKQKLANVTSVALEEAEAAGERANGELQKNVLLKKGLLFVSFYIMETLELAKEKLGQADRLAESLLKKLEWVDSLVKETLDLHKETEATRAQAKKDAEQARKDAAEAEHQRRQNIAIEEELTIERININKEKRRLKING